MGRVSLDRDVVATSARRRAADARHPQVAQQQRQAALADAIQTDDGDQQRTGTTGQGSRREDWQAKTDARYRGGTSSDQRTKGFGRDSTTVERITEAAASGTPAAESLEAGRRSARAEVETEISSRADRAHRPAVYHRRDRLCSVNLERQCQRWLSVGIVGIGPRTKLRHRHATPQITRRHRRFA